MKFDKYDVLDYFLDLHEAYVKTAHGLELEGICSDLTDNYSYNYSVEKNSEDLDAIRHAIKIIAAQESDV